MAVAGKPTLLIRSDASIDGDYSAITKTGSGTATITAGGSDPVDDFDVVVEFPAGGTVGAAGITYRYSLNGGKTFSKVFALGVEESLMIPGTGISLELGTGTIAAKQRVMFTTTGPANQNDDLPDALEALRVTSSPWDAALIDVEADDETVAICDLFLEELASKRGKFRTIVLTARPRGASETPAQYKEALDATFDAAASTDVLVCADRADVVSLIRGISTARPTGLFVAARGMKIPIGRDAAYVNDGPLKGAKITDDRGNPKHHDESNFPGLDDLRLTTLRTFDGFPGVYITNARLLSPTGSDYVYWQHARVINRACEIAWQVLTQQLSLGVKADETPGPNDERYIAEESAQLVEGLANDAIRRELGAQADDLLFRLSRTDDISSNEGAEINASLEVVSLSYVKKWKVAAGYTKAISDDA